MKVYLAQINTTVGDFEGNLDLILHSLKEAENEGADIAVFPEMCLPGYPPLDLLNYSSFAERSKSSLEKLARKVKETAVLVGYVEKASNKEGLDLFNSAALLHRGKVVFTQRKMLLPTYDIFDEKRYFEPSPNAEVFDFKGVMLGITICEDIWNDRHFWSRPRYNRDPVEILMKKGAQLIINLSASPFNLGKIKLRYDMLTALASRHKVPVVLVNAIGGNTDIVFDGTSMVIDDGGNLVASLGSFREDSIVVDVSDLKPDTKLPAVNMEIAEQAYNALVLGVGDYFKKCGFKKAVLGLSGGIDSAVTMCIAAEALGIENLLAIVMPTRFTPESSIEDALKLAKTLGADYRLMPIEEIFDSYLHFFKDEFKGREADVTEENFQARIRGNVLMGFSNKYGHLLLTTGNKSELAVGYCTLYGDMSGGLSVLSDVPKTLVYQIAAHINREKEIIPNRIITKPPSAELKENQFDQDSLPPYEMLDEVIRLYIEQEKDMEEIVAEGFDRALVARIINMIEQNEFKRKQAPPGIKITSRAFGFGRRMPIAKKNYR